MSSDTKLLDRPPIAAIEPIMLDAVSAAELLAISPRTLAALTARGAVPSVLLGSRRLYSLAALREWAAKGCLPIASAEAS